MKSLDIEQILLHLPHRYPFLLVDRVLECEPGKHLVALKNVTVNEPYFQGHFPGYPVMPGVMIIEAMAQAAAILSYLTIGELPDGNKLFYFAGIDEARFKRPVVPGDQLVMRVEVQRILRGIGRFACEARVGEALAAQAVMLAALRDKR